MRSAPGVGCVLLAILVVGLTPAAQADSRAAGTGPLYSVETLRAFELFGVHLGMTRDEARKALAAAGLTLRDRYPEDPEQDVIGESYDVPGGGGSGSLYTFGIDYKRWPGRVPTVFAFGYYRSFPRGEAPDLQQRREDLVKRFGPPSHWRLWPGSKDEMAYAAAYVPLASLVDELARDEATTCMIQWECLEGQERAACRKKMKRARVPIVHVSLLPQSEDYGIHDYEATYAELARAPGFHSRRAQAYCQVPSVH